MYNRQVCSLKESPVMAKDMKNKKWHTYEVNCLEGACALIESETSETEEVEDQFQYNHPLLNDLVLEELIKFIHIKDLKRCRLVCRKWNHLIIPRCRQDFTVSLTSPEKSNKIANFIELVNNSNDIPFGKFCLYQVRMNHPSTEKFFLACGPYMKHLSLQQFTRNEIDVSSLRETLLFRAPYLESLEINEMPEEITNHDNLFMPWCGMTLCGPYLQNLRTIHLYVDCLQRLNVNFFTDLFAATSNLEDLKFRSCMTFQCTTIILRAIIEANHCKKLKKLDLGEIDTGHVELMNQLSELGMHLKKVSFDYVSIEVDDGSLRKFLHLQRNSLEYLKINESTDLHIHFPVIKTLRVLSRTSFSRCLLFSGPICYATHLPNLTELTIKAFADELDWDQYFSEPENKVPCLSLRKLVVPIHFKQGPHLKRLAKIFPKVKFLDIYSPCNSIIPILWDIWPELESLKMCLTKRNDNIDYIFTGISLEECAYMRDTDCFDNPNNIRCQPSITNLKQLRRLRLEIETWSDDIYSCDESDNDEEIDDTSYLLSDVAGYFAFAQMTQLHELSISRSLISAECYQEIRRRLPSHAYIKIRDINRVPLGRF